MAMPGGQRDAVMERAERAERALKGAAVLVRGAHYEYRRFPFDAEVVLSGLDMTVRRGEIYALLGRSGCGKTTLLRALVGQHALDSGAVLVFGRPPGDPEGGVPGAAVGYMPQEVAVHDGLTVGETLSFQGRLVGMPSTAILEGTRRLLALLGLPGAGRLVGALSGGEKRRVSLAIALLHSPPLIVLDEPTVGVDPVLRHSVWQLLRAEAARGAAVLVSTHYTEEARHAHTVGLLRSGRLAVEDSPEAILALYGEADGGLEEAVRRLCGHLDHDGLGHDDVPPTSCAERQRRRSTELAGPAREEEPPVLALLPAPGPPRAAHKLRALLWKDCVYLWRHGAVLAAQALFFVFITVLACAVLGHWPQEVRVDVVNEDADCADWPRPGAEPLSCAFIARLPQRGLRPVLQGDVAAARAAVHSGLSWGVLHFAQGFTPALAGRLADRGSSNDTLAAYLDTTDFVVSNMIAKRLSELMMEVVSSLSPSMSNPLRFEESVYGKREPVSTDTLMPGVLLGYMTTFAASLVMSTLLMEKLDKLMERSLVAGVRMSELMACWAAVLLPVVLAVSLLSHALVFGPMAVPCAGSIALVFLLCAALCLMTTLAGLLIASLFDNYLAAVLACHQFVVSFVFLSGMLWPLEGMHWSLRWLALLMPWAHSMEAARAVLQRGWGLRQTRVWLGFASCGAWAALILGALVLVHRRPRRAAR